MTPHKYPEAMTARKVIDHLARLTDAIDDATFELEDFIVQLVDSEHWTQLSWAELALAMGVSRQAVQQRVARLLARGVVRKARREGEDPNQMTLEEALASISADDLPPAKGRKR